MIICEICKKELKNRKSLGSHLCKSHKEISTKKYYDKYFLIENENICKNENCNNTTNQFKGLTKGYIKSYCSISCARKSKEVIEKQKKTCLEKYDNENYRNINSYKKTCLEKYGKENALCKGTKSYNKKINTCLEKYGVENVFSDDDICKKIRLTNEKSGFWQKRDVLNNFQHYYEEVKKLTNKNKKLLFEKWNGDDYYDNEYIFNNFVLNNNDNNYPSVDHKKSIKYCFINKISPKKCSNIDNLCITKRIINIIKNSDDELEFKNQLKQIVIDKKD